MWLSKFWKSKTWRDGNKENRGGKKHKKKQILGNLVIGDVITARFRVHRIVMEESTFRCCTNKRPFGWLISGVVKGSRQGVICKDFRLIDFCFLQGLFWLICHLWFSKRGVIFTLSFRLLALGSLGWCLAQTTAGYCQFCVRLWNTALQCLFQRLFENTCVWLPPLTAWTSVFTHYREKKGKGKGKDKRLSMTIGISFKRQTAVFRGKKFK